MEQLYFKDVFQYPIKEFKYHLEQQANERIIFSGKYGVGKTRFLEDFFSAENQNELYKVNKFEVYRLSPINYSIASNEDIIRYIKYDIIIEMLKRSIDLDEIKLTLLDTLPIYIKNNLHKVTAGLVYMIPKLGKEIVDCFDKIDKLKEEFLKYHDEVNESSGDKIVKYIEQIELREGSIYENDITTKIIAEAISKNDKKESVLIIDDVDRLDPEHVFRILNVFASHFEGNSNSGNKNKFNFDKIIIVCDFNNIRNIFHHRYGLEVDFMGYIDKFYTSNIYHFDNKKALGGIVKNIYESILIETIANDNKSILQQFYFQNSFVFDLTNSLISQGFVSLRNILKLYKKHIGYHYEKIDFDKRNNDISAWLNPIVMQLKLIKDLFGDYRNMRNGLEKLVLTDDFLEKHERRFAELLYILSSNIHNYYSKNEFVYIFQEIPILIEVKRRFQNEQFEYAYLFNSTGQNENDKPQKGNQFTVTANLLKRALIDSVELLHKTGYLK